MIQKDLLPVLLRSFDEETSSVVLRFVVWKTLDIERFWALVLPTKTHEGGSELREF